jgi:transcriptional regulator GlxA family with amidase domain
LAIFADRHFSNAHDAYDLLLVAGGPGLVRREFTDESYAWLKRASRQAGCFGAICSGVFILARAGLLDHRIITIHANYADELAALCPTARVEVDRPFVEDGNVYTSAGATAAVDLPLHLLNLDKGSEVASKVAERLYASMQRAGGKSQSSPHFTPSVKGCSRVAQVQQYVLSNLADDLSVKALARIANMSIRTFARTFVHDTKISPAEYVMDARMNAARVMLQGSEIPLKAIAYACGFGNPDRMRCVFQRCLGISPRQYRLHYQSETCLDRELYAPGCHAQACHRQSSGSSKTPSPLGYQSTDSYEKNFSVRLKMFQQTSQ